MKFKGFSTAIQFILGFLIGIALLLGGAAAVGYVIFTRMASPPDKPIFAEEKAEPVAKAEPAKKPPTAKTQTKDGTKAKTGDKTAADKKETQPPAAQKPEDPAPTEVKKEEKPQELPTGAYKGRVTWSTGLSLRSDPNTSAERVGGVDYNSELIILSTSSDGQWQKVRVANGSQEGWIKAGNIKKSGE